MLNTRPEMEEFYIPSLNAIVKAVQKQRQTASRPISVDIFTVIRVRGMLTTA